MKDYGNWFRLFRADRRNCITSAAHKPLRVRKIDIGDTLPYGQQPIDYSSPIVDDPVARLDRRLAMGPVKLTYRPGSGYLKSVLAKTHRLPVAERRAILDILRAMKTDLTGCYWSGSSASPD